MVDLSCMTWYSIVLYNFLATSLFIIFQVVDFIAKAGLLILRKKYIYPIPNMLQLPSGHFACHSLGYPILRVTYSSRFFKCDVFTLRLSIFIIYFYVLISFSEMASESMPLGRSWISSSVIRWWRILVKLDFSQGFCICQLSILFKLGEMSTYLNANFELLHSFPLSQL